MRKPVFTRPQHTDEVRRVLYERVRRVPSAETVSVFSDASKLVIQTERGGIVVPVYTSLPEGVNGMLAVVGKELYFFNEGWVKAGGVSVVGGGAVVVVGSVSDINVDAEGILWFVTADNTLYLTTNNQLVRIPYRYSTVGSAPTTPLVGDLWYDTTNGVLYIWDGSTWRATGGGTPSSTVPATANAVTAQTGTEMAYSRGDHRHLFTLPTAIASATPTPAMALTQDALYINKNAGTDWVIVPAQMVSLTAPTVRTVSSGQDIRFETSFGVPVPVFAYTTGAPTSDFSLRTALQNIYYTDSNLKPNIRVYYRLAVIGAVSVNYKYALSFQVRWLDGTAQGSVSSGDLTIPTNTAGRGAVSGQVDITSTTSGMFVLEVTITRRRSIETGMPTADTCRMFASFQVAVR